MSGTIVMKLIKKISKEELQYGFSKKEIQVFLKNRVMIYNDTESKTRVSDYKDLIRKLTIWCNMECEGFYRIETEYSGGYNTCFFFQSEEDLVRFKLTHDGTPSKQG